MERFRRLFRTNMPVRNCTEIPEVRTEPRREKDSEDHPRNTIYFQARINIQIICDKLLQ